jgi:hypothetical protein
MRIKSPNKNLRKLLWLAPSLLPILGGTAQAQQIGNVVQPSDHIIASSANEPASEGVANAIDGTSAKYLNFDGATGPCGFVVTPSAGATIVSGLAIQTANDSPNRDPDIMTIEGTTNTPTGWADANTTWTLIYSNSSPTTTNRFQWQFNYFTNTTPYTSYRWTAVTCQGSGQNSMQVAEVQLLGFAAPPNILTPGDHIIASSANEPASEGVANAIDGTEAKYLNFDGATGPCGFVVTPTAGATVVSGLAIQTANDSPNRDPDIMTIEGTTNTPTGWADANTTWTLIYSNSSPTTTNRFQWEYFYFTNNAPYTSYRWTAVTCQGSGQNSMQVSEVQLLGLSAPLDVVIPSDHIIASSANEPASEGVANAIDGTSAKYLNFDGATGPCGFVVTPSAGATTLTGLGILTANDSPNRDPNIMTIEGTTNTPTGWADANTTWTLIYSNSSPTTTNRFQWEYFYFYNNQPFTSYRWTAVTCQGSGQNSMQVGEVQLLAVSTGANCAKAAFTSTPNDTPVLPNSSATFFCSVNGPWPLQWYTNGVAVPGANKSSFTTAPITAANTNIGYSVGIVGCATSPTVHAQLFTPSTTQSIGIEFAGSGANGAPVYLASNDITGVQQQAFWNIASNGVASTGTSGDGTTMSTLIDSSNNPTTITFNFSTGGSWGVGVDTTKPVGRLLNGVAGQTAVGTPQTLTFGNLPQGKYSIIAYSVSPPLEVNEQYFTMTNTATDTNVATLYQQTLDAGQYNTAPGFYSTTSSNINTPSIANTVRFNNLVPDSTGNLQLTYGVTGAVGGGRPVGVNAVQLLINPPAVGSAPTIVTQPQFTVAPSNGSLTMSVGATGSGLQYQWRLNGVNLFNGGAYSGVNTATLTISPFTPAQQGIYSVAIFNAAGSTISGNAAASVSTYNISSGLAVYWPFDAKNATNEPSGVAGGPAATFLGSPTATNGVVSNAVVLDGFTTYGYAPSYTLASNAISGAAWVNGLFPINILGNTSIMRNIQGQFTQGGGAVTIIGQFSFDLDYDSVGGGYAPTAIVGLGPVFASVTAPATAEIFSNGWHHVAFSADGASLVLYMDGTNVASVPYTGTVTANPSQPWISIGCGLTTDTNATPPVDLDSTINLMQGQLDDVALWDRALTPSEVSAIYQAGRAGKSLLTVTESLPTTGPTLTAAVSGTNLVLTWAPTGGRLQSAPALIPGGGTVWSVVSSNNPATVPIGKGNSFFRVINP